MTPFYVNLTFWMYLVAGAPYALFVVFYAVRTPSWRTTPVGRGLMSLGISLTSMFAFILLVLAVPVPEDIRQALRTLLLGGITLAGFLLLKNLLVLQRQQRLDSLDEQVGAP